MYQNVQNLISSDATPVLAVKLNTLCISSTKQLLIRVLTVICYSHLPCHKHSEGECISVEVINGTEQMLCYHIILNIVVSVPVLLHTEAV